GSLPGCRVRSAALSPVARRPLLPQANVGWNDLHSHQTGGNMESSIQEAHLPALGAHPREEVGHQLQSLLVELIDLSLIGKQLHWNVEGPQFRSLHLQLDELVESWRELSDQVAERAVAIGVAPDG